MGTLLLLLVIPEFHLKCAVRARIAEYLTSQLLYEVIESIGPVSPDLRGEILEPELRSLDTLLPHLRKYAATSHMPTHTALGTLMVPMPACFTHRCTHILHNSVKSTEFYRILHVLLGSQSQNFNRFYRELVAAHALNFLVPVSSLTEKLAKPY